MRRLDHDADAARVQLFHQQVRDRFRHPLLELRTFRDRLDDPRDLAQPDDAPLRQIADMRLSDKRQQVVFAHRMEVDVLHDHHRIVFLGEEFLQVLRRVLVQALEQLGVHPGDALGRLDQPFAIRVFADRAQNFPHRSFDTRFVDFKTFVRFAVHFAFSVAVASFLRDLSIPPTLTLSPSFTSVKTSAVAVR